MFQRTGGESQHIRTFDNDQNLRLSRLQYDSPDLHAIERAHADIQKLDRLANLNHRFATAAVRAYGRAASFMISNSSPYRRALRAMTESDTHETLAFPSKALSIGQLVMGELKVNRSFYSGLMFSDEFGVEFPDRSITPANIIIGLTFAHQDTNRFLENSWDQLRDFSEASLQDENPELLKQTFVELDGAFDRHNRSL